MRGWIFFAGRKDLTGIDMQGRKDLPYLLRGADGLAGRTDRNRSGGLTSPCTCTRFSSRSTRDVNPFKYGVTASLQGCRVKTGS